MKALLVLAVLCGLTVAFFVPGTLEGAAKVRDDTTQKAKAKAAEAMDAGATRLRGLGDKASEKADEAKEATSDAVNDTVQGAKSAVSRSASGAWEAAKSAGSKVVDKAKETQE